MVAVALPAQPSTVASLVHPEWPPLRHVRRGWEFLAAEERQEIEARLQAVLAQHTWGPHNRDALLHFFTFLAQVETIAIEIPFKASWKTPDAMHPTLRRQLVDEVFHSLLFSRLAHELAHPAAQPPSPLPSAQRMLDRIRDEPDMAVGGTLLNLVAEGWIETVFKHALSWHVADAVFAAVLADESRHVQEAGQYLPGLDPAAAERAVRDLEQGLAEVSGEPTVALAITDLAGHDGARALRLDIERTHRAHLAEVGLQAHPRWEELMGPALAGSPGDGPQPVPVDDTPWRAASRSLWGTPRDPTMQGAFDVAVGHIPRRLLTPVLVAAVGRAWAKNPRLNRIVGRGRTWQLPHANVGVRVLVAEDELATVVVHQADRRSVADIQRILADGLEQLRAMRRLRPAQDARRLAEGFGQAMDLMPPDAQSFAVSLSNTGKFGVQEGAGAFTGAVAPATDLTVGTRRRMPVWRAVAYLPAWQARFGCLQDHRVFDGQEAGTAMRAIQAELTPAAVRAILRAPDTVPVPSARPTYDQTWFATLPAPVRTLAAVGFHKGWPSVVPYVVAGGATAAAIVGAALHSGPPPRDLEMVPPKAPATDAPARANPVAEAEPEGDVPDDVPKALRKAAGKGRRRSP